MSTVRDNFPYTRFLMIGAFAQLAMAALLYIAFALNAATLAILGGLSLLCLILGGKVENRFSRVVVRSIAYSLPILCLAVCLFSLFYTVAVNGSTADVWLLSLNLAGMTAVLLFETTLLLAIPVLAVTAQVQQKRCDIFMLRLFALLQLAMALFTVLYVIDTNTLTLGIDNGYYNLFYCLVCAITALCALAAFPIKTRWLARLFRGDEAAEDTDKSEETMPDTAEKVEEESVPAKPIFRDR